MPKSVYLCGFMGCGKSYIIRRAKTLFGIAACDLDECIIKAESMTIPEIFKEKGEDYFRSREFEILKNLTGLVALGGGTLTNEKCALFAKENAYVIFINTDFDVCYERIKDDSNRPVAYGKSKEELNALYLYRVGIYKRSADFIMTDADEIAEKIYELLIY